MPDFIHYPRQYEYLTLKVEHWDIAFTLEEHSAMGWKLHTIVPYHWQAPLIVVMERRLADREAGELPR